jgi:hypothetical protein
LSSGWARGGALLVPASASFTSGGSLPKLVGAAIALDT